MFDDPAAATRALERYFDPPHIRMIVEALVPTVIFKPLAGARIVLGGTKFGGTPDLPKGTEWPRPVAPDDPEDIAQRGNDEMAEVMRTHLASGLPYAFIAQVDLTEASALGPVTSALPSEGRLLFYYDITIGPWETGVRPARVVWDRSPREDLASAVMPADLAAADLKEREELAGIEGLQTDVQPGSNFSAPAREMTLSSTLRLPDRMSLDYARIGATGDDDFDDAYDEALEESRATVPSDASARQQLLGSPIPEQDDPRYDAVVVSKFGKQYLSRQEWDTHRGEIAAEAGNWTLLFQLDLGDWMQRRFVEGTVYFLIEKTDLKKRRFDKVIAVYQQT